MAGAADGAPATGNPTIIAGVDGSGNVQTLAVDTSGNLSISASVAGTVDTGLGKAEDSAHASGHTGVMLLAVREATPTDLSAGATDGDYEPLQVDASGRLWVNASAVASGATDSGNPVKVGGKYNSTLPTFTDGQRGDIQITSRGNLRAELYGSNSTTGIAASSPADTVTSANVGLNVTSFQHAYNGSTFERVRIATIFKTATATASGDTAIWTPTSGKKFRVLAYCIEVTQDAATSGGADISAVLRDSTTAIGLGSSIFIPAVAATTLGSGYNSGWRNIGNGVLSSAANNVLNINLSAALTSGVVRVNVCGTEE